ncbi:Wzz/FepE/Etk N-terminal domain-containing protein [Cytobacillus firmus]|uniref:Wzz/FepE/Etk N-terminal domain-containing protein n=1 Tax=Cytobacillus TaxID=2675230 RepID=UPI002041B98B|nr:Wzz/FepE/Etk N-terminal domain-containing protein [Cytobacillus oceanisediminis]MCM3246079.1 Wzz/FepE/Etk N-terminal domain-containing protein [Cytobacillus oceanisediminis]MCS0827760.1 Wzz/FepE/Etk N-terminal domain-containing protein [Cytobacillus firmus]
MEKIKYPVYDYIKFIWKKKLLLIGFTILCMVIGAALSYARPTVYTSTALVFTGNGNNDELSKPDLITGRYKEELPDEFKSSLNVKADPFQITLSLSGADKEEVETNLNKVADKYTNDLKEDFDDLNEAMDNYKNALEEKVKKTEESITQYEQLIQETSNDSKLISYSEILINKMDMVDKYRADFHEAEYDLALLEAPKKSDVKTIQSSNNNLLKNALLAGAFGFQLMLILLVLWKYIINARRALSQRQE